MSWIWPDLFRKLIESQDCKHPDSDCQYLHPGMRQACHGQKQNVHIKIITLHEDSGFVYGLQHFCQNKVLEL